MFKLSRPPAAPLIGEEWEQDERMVHFFLCLVLFSFFFHLFHLFFTLRSEFSCVLSGEFVFPP